MNKMYNKSKLFIHIIIMSFIITFVLNNQLVASEKVDSKSKNEHTIYKVITKNLRIRKEPSITSQVVGSLSKDSLFYSHLDWYNSDNGKVLKPDKEDVVDGKNGKWVNIYLDSVESIGFVFSAYLEDVTTNYSVELYGSPGFSCSSSNKQLLECEDDHSYTLTIEEKKKEKAFSLQFISRVFYYTLDCNDKKTIKEYKSYSEIKSNYGSPATQYWIVISDKKTNFPVQLYFAETPWECGE